jgi:hypothetical protein
MKAAILQLNDQSWTMHPRSKLFDISTAQLVLCFAEKKILSAAGIFDEVKNKFPNSSIVMCSSAGEIFYDAVLDGSMTVIALHFDDTPIHAAMVSMNDFENSKDAAAALVKKLSTKELTYIMVLSDGSVVDGSELVRGLNSILGEQVIVTGGLAGDGAGFSSTLVGMDCQPAEGNIVAIGFYGKSLRVKHGSRGGWDSFGLERLVTRSSGNKLFEIDHKNALDLYKKYLGPDADNLPGSALLFPLAVIKPGNDQPVVRTILSIDHETNSMTFAGGIPEGSKLRFMKANFDKLTAAAFKAAVDTTIDMERKPDFSLMISCVGRKLVLGPRIDEEVEAVLDALGEQTPAAGFYSYGEIAPFNSGGKCRLHNQTMTITSFYELP